LVFIAGILAFPMLNGGCFFCSGSEIVVQASTMAGEEIQEMESFVFHKSFSLKKIHPKILVNFALHFGNRNWNYQSFSLSFFDCSALFSVINSKLSINAP